MGIYNRTSMGEKAGVGAGLGAIGGAIAATVGTVWGGYEIGSAINDGLSLYSTPARAIIDIVTMSLIASPVYTAGILAGTAAGSIIGTAVHPVVERVKDISDLVRSKIKS